MDRLRQSKRVNSCSLHCPSLTEAKITPALGKTDDKSSSKGGLPGGSLAVGGLRQLFRDFFQSCSAAISSVISNETVCMLSDQEARPVGD